MIIYPTRYQAYKARIRGCEYVVRVTGGYAVMTHHEYHVWKKQK